VVLFNNWQEPSDSVSGWRDDGYFYYLCASHEQWNRPVLTAWATGRPIQVMQKTSRGRGFYRFVDSFVLEDQVEQRLVLPDGRVELLSLFRLRTVHDVTHQPCQIGMPGDARQVGLCRVERLDLLRRDAIASPLEAERPETKLTKSFERYLLSQGHPVHRLAIRHTADCEQLFTDTWVGSLNLLIEAKAGTKQPRQNLRMALGQLADYTRFIRGVRKAVLLPERPIGDLVALAADQDVDVIWPEDDRWFSTGRWLSEAGIDHWSAGHQSSANLSFAPDG
jgi:hypothetical protein